MGYLVICLEYCFYMLGLNIFGIMINGVFLVERRCDGEEFESYGILRIFEELWVFSGENGEL